MKRRKIAIIIAAIAVVALGVAYFFVRDFVKTEPVERREKKKQARLIFYSEPHPIFVGTTE